MTTNSNGPFLPIKNDGDTIGGRISRARDAMGLTIAQVASQAGVRKDTAISWERDRAEPRTNKLVTLAGILNVSPVWLITGAGEGPTDNSDPDKVKIQSLIHNIKELQSETTRAIAALEQLVVATLK